MRTIHRFHLAVFLLAALALIGTSQQTHGQVSNPCCTFDVFTSSSTPNGCLPLAIQTSWNGILQPDVIPTKGAPYGKSVTGCLTGPVTLDSIHVDGRWVTPTTPLPWMSPCFTWSCGGGGTNFRITVAADPVTGCLVIRMVPC